MIARFKKLLTLPRRYLAFLQDWRAYRKLSDELGDDRFVMNPGDRLPMLWENSSSTAFDAHYVYHTAWAVRVVNRLAPARHIDISSTLFFCSTLSATVPVEFYDFRPAPLTLDNLVCGRADLSALEFPTASITSLSCMHVVEHIGLGRYGDPVDPQGDIKAVSELKRVLAPGGHLLFVVPVGLRSLNFNAHRTYDLAAVAEMFEGYELLSSALVTDDARFVENPSPELVNRQAYGCGCFLFRKPAPAEV